MCFCVKKKTHFPSSSPKFCSRYSHFPRKTGKAKGDSGVEFPQSEAQPPLSPPNETTLCTGVYGEPPFWVPASPLPEPPCCPLILKYLAMPLGRLSSFLNSPLSHNAPKLNLPFNLTPPHSLTQTARSSTKDSGIQ